MNKLIGTYRFTRPVNSLVGFGSRNRASTDALGALYQWRDSHIGRKFEVIIDEDEMIEVTLEFENGDVNAGSNLDALCGEHGVERTFVP